MAEASRSGSVPSKYCFTCSVCICSEFTGCYTSFTPSGDFFKFPSCAMQFHANSCREWRVMAITLHGFFNQGQLISQQLSLGPFANFIEKDLHFLILHAF